MKILQVCLTYHSHFGGVAEHVRNIAERLARKYHVTVFSTDPDGYLQKKEVINGVEIRRFKSMAPGGAYYFSEGLRKSLKENSKDYDIVHAHNYHAFPALYAAQAKSKNKLVFTPHYHSGGHTLFRSLLHIPYRYVARKIFERADQVICVSKYEKSLILEKFKVDETKLVVIPNGMNPGEFEGLERKTDIGNRVILYVGRLEKYKGVDHLVKVLPKMNDDISLEIVGKGSRRKALLKLANRLRVTDRVSFYQDLPREKLLRKYAEANLFSLLSKHEAYGISVAEALAAKTPCIVANTSALKEWIDNKNCFAIDYPIDLERLAYLINKIIGKKTDPIQLPTWEETVNKLTRVYDRVLNNKEI